MENRLMLSKRLKAVADMVTQGNVVCDVGCDHGFVSIYLVKNGISPKVIAMDVNEGPLQAAREHIGEYQLTDYIETRLSDGVAALGIDEADTLICAGMGGRLMIRILEEGKEKVCRMRELILQPQSDLQSMREYLRSQGYLIADENMILEDGKYYPMMRVCPVPAADGDVAEAGWQQIEDKYGPVLLAKKHPVLKEFLQREADICKQILQNLENNGNGQTQRQEEILCRMKSVERALGIYNVYNEAEV